MNARPITARWPLVRWRLLDGLIAGVALIPMLAGLIWLIAADRGLSETQVRLEQTPVTVSMQAETDRAPVVVIAHGFSGSRQMMASFARTLARNGYVAVNFDFPGHGANPRPLEGEIGEQRRTQILLDALASVVDYARTLPQYEGRLALLGHSMAGDIAVRYAAQGSSGGPAADLDALVAVSPYLSQDLGAHTPGRTPDNLLFIYGAWEPRMIHDQGRAAVAAVADRPAEAIQPNVTYGDHGDGSARRLVIADKVEHIGVLYSASALEAALSWLDQVFEHAGSGWVDARGPWLGLYFLGVVLLAWPLSRLLPRISSEPLGAGLAWRRLWPAALLPALLTPLILWPFPTDFLAIAIADYIALHFLVYAALTGLMLAVIRRRSRQVPSPAQAAGQPVGRSRATPSYSAFIIALLAVIAYQTLTIALPTDRYVAAFLPDRHRFATLLMLLVATLAWFIADEWLTRGRGAFIGGYALTKALFLLSLILAVVLNLEELFFLVIIIPAILILFVVFSLFSGWIYRRTGHPLVAALANALVLAVAITVSFPIAD
ncbi:alpha/beta hydrolase [Halochromatium salexigens]|uniref:Serine aminopeptidase S33 domain-containing protein n=1 Tax=Halochromatium salexigens TaxID=49447 RepID=A0AAJ0XGI8_HALSE|nr:alpha/beta fold hydrolase [Halochromatium salexigens]MBK5931573.1 hypothetical protein [Halochromatium salexigens]